MLTQRVVLMKKRSTVISITFLFLLFITPTNLSIYNACSNNVKGVWEDTKEHFPEIYAYAKNQNCFAFSVRVERHYVSVR